jgi:membrane-associated protein
VFDWLTDQVTNEPVTYLVVLVAAAGDVLFPLIPSETIVITASVLAAQGSIHIWLIVPLVALGAFAGDNVSYLLGRLIGDPVARRLFRGERAQARLAWAEQAIARRGGLLILVGRFIPGGRTASTFASGTLEMPYARFARADAAAALIWALYASMLGYVGGASFKDSLWKPLALSLGVAGVAAGVIEGWRRLQMRRGKDILGDKLGR